MHIWGRHADHVGNLKIVKLSSKFVALVPLLWLVSPSAIYLVGVQIFAGFFWAGFNLGVTNFMYDAVTPEKRTRCVAYFNMVNGAAIFSGAALGGYLAGVIPSFMGNRLLSLFILSGIFRLLATGISSFVKEVRKVKDISQLDLFYSIIGIRPGLGQAIFLSSEKE
jgi:MFS family permease